MGDVGSAAVGSEDAMIDQEARANLERFEADACYVEQHWDELLAKYPDHCIAVYDQQVVGADKDPRRVVEALKRKGIPPSHAYRKWLSTSDDLLIVPVRTR